MLDYVGVDYPEFVKDGKVLDEAEYVEQREFAAQSVEILRQLPAVPDQAALVEQARQLLARIETKAPGAEVSALAAAVRTGVIRAYDLTVAPRVAPDLARAAALFEAHCAACHGAQGRGDGPLAQGMDPAPSDFHDTARMEQRSLYGLYNTITLGVNGTPMRSFGELAEDDRWALAFFAGAMRTSEPQRTQGEAAWRDGVGRDKLGDLKALVMVTPGELQGGEREAYAYLAAQPQALAAGAPSPIAFARQKVAEAVQAAGRGDREGARQLAIAAYLEGFELIENALDNVDAPLRQEIEREMMALRAAVGGSQPGAAAQQVSNRLEPLLARAEAQLSGNGLSTTTAFVSSLLILLREGLEAILVLAAIGAFVIKSGRRDALPYLHAGWIAAVALGAVTWFIAKHLFAISGAQRELTEGITALLAAAMLLYVGWWLHRKSNAQAWQSFVREQVTGALGKKTLWAMAGVSFLAVYRELFEIILFYETLWLQAGPGGHSAVLWGMAAAAVLLVLLGGAILRYSVRLPIGPFFSVTSGMLALLAIVFIGNGIAALQEAGKIGATEIHFFTVPLLGVYPTAESIGGQALILSLVLAGLIANRRLQRG
ncbi:FTR1 family protein [Caldimonas tepidiphila]|uniref:FTR1 family protein n=1 Tax=Caldimonas tepidiphila TaxID=2315841 RepID=UPI001F0C485C|nr:cytochrome c/FTR1 family iron permease [Caldimonas tepidiphila]